MLEISFPQAPGFHAKTKEPFQSAFLQNGGSLFHSAGMKIKGGTNAEHDGLDFWLVRRHPAFLLRASQADKENPCAGIHYLLGKNQVLII